MKNIENKYQFTKYDLQNGDFIITEDDSQGLIIINDNNVDSGLIAFIKIGYATLNFINLCDINDNMEWNYIKPNSICFVYRCDISIKNKIQEKYCIYNRKKIKESSLFNRAKWITKWYDSAMKDPTFIYFIDKNYGFTYGYIIKKINKEFLAQKIIRKVSVKCKGVDKFDTRTGIAIVYAKLTGERIPEEI